MVSLTGTWMQSVAQAWLVLKLTNSPLTLGIIGALQSAPVFLFSIFAGVLIDRIPKRTLLLFTQSVLTLQALILGILTLTKTVAFWHIAVLATVLGLANTMDMPGRQAFIKEMVKREDAVMNAVALNSTIFNLARVLGPGIAGLLMTRFDIGIIFILNAFTFLPVLWSIHRMEAGREAPKTNTTILKSATEGLHYVRSQPVLFRLLLLLAFLSIFSINFNVLIPVFAKIYLHETAKGYGLLMSSMGLGALAGAGFLILLSRRGPQSSLIYGGALGLCIFQALLPLTHSIPSASPLLFLAGASMIIYISTTNTLLQVTSLDEYRGRVMSLYILVFGGATPIGNPLIGTLTEHLGVPFALLFGGLLGAVITLIFAGWRLYARRPTNLGIPFPGMKWRTFK